MNKYEISADIYVEIGFEAADDEEANTLAEEILGKFLKKVDFLEIKKIDVNQVDY